MTVSGVGGAKGLLSLQETAGRCRSLGAAKMGEFKIAVPLPPIASASASAACGHVMGICNVRNNHTEAWLSTRSYVEDSPSRSRF